jgi:hypothetical protein
MRTRTGWLALLLTAGMTLAPNAVWGQRFAGGDDVPPEDPPTFLPLYHDRPETGGFFAAGEFLWWQQTNPIKNQAIVLHGFVDVDGSLQNFINVVQGNVNAQATPGQFFGSHLEALDANQVGGPNGYIPGFGITLGWRFGDGVALEFTWRHLETVKLNAVATGVAPNSDWPGFLLADTFLFSPVFNFPPEFAGPITKITVVAQSPAGNVSGANFSTTITVGAGGSINSSTGPTANDTAANITGPVAAMILAAVSNRGNGAVPGAAYGIWNGATVENETFIQRHDEFELIGRIPIYQGECCRCYGLAGLRHVQIWERFQWTTWDYPASNAALNTATLNLNEFIANAQAPGTSNAVSVLLSETAGTPINTLFGTQADPQDVAVYSNIVSNRLYGPMVGCGSEWYLGHGFAASLDLRVGLLADFVKEEAKYERIDRYISNHRVLREFLISPELDAMFNFWYYPVEGVQIRVGWDAMAFFNTGSSPQPVSFNYGALDPPWDNHTFRLFQGLSIGVGLIF